MRPGGAQPLGRQQQRHLARRGHELARLSAESWRSAVSAASVASSAASSVAAAGAELRLDDYDAYEGPALGAWGGMRK